MNNLAPRPAGVVAIPHSLLVPPVPAAVAQHAAAVAIHAEQRAAFAAVSPSKREDLFVGSAPRAPVLANRDRDAAQRAAEALAWQMRPVPQGVFRAWLGPVNAAVRNPQSAEDFEVRCAGLHALLDDLPAGCFTGEARRTLPAFFPSAEDIRRAVEPGARKIRALADALAAALASTTTQPVPESAAQLTPEEIAAMQATARRVAQELRASASEREMGERAPVRAVPLSDGALLAQYEALAAQGKTAAQVRAAALRAKLAVSA